MITFRAPPDGVPIEPIIVPYAIENKVSKTAFLPSGFDESIFLITDSPIGNIIAMIVCSPKKEDQTADINIKPAINTLLLLPNILIMIFASRISSP